MERNEELWGLAQRSAQGFLRRFEDPLTRNERDDLVQETAWTAWRWVGTAREPARFAAAVRTIARRHRYRLLVREHRRRLRQAHLLQVRSEGPPQFSVLGRCVSSAWLLGCLRWVLGGLRELDRALLLGIHEGFCCAELAARFHRTEQSVKVRIHRARARVRREIELAVLTADDLEVWPETP
ncbi:MAG: sigma-70 family RNA polymerase sigma factor [Planctomycetes bacterium]|nr:sigma-70 family RNA polymerase sigma factor [Planctomycetota bacterium]